MHPSIGELRQHVAELADAVVSANDQLLSLYRLTQFASASLDSNVASQETVEEARSGLGATGVAFISNDPNTSPGHTPMSGTVSSSLLNVAAATTASLPQLIPHHANPAMLAEVRTNSRCYGALVAERDHGPFGTADLKLLDAMASHLALILELSALHEDRVHQAVLQRDYDTASALARAALNRPLPVSTGMELGAASIPARAAGGDFYAAGRSKTGVYVALGDVSGKGLPAALVMTSAISSTHSAFARHPEGDASHTIYDVESQICGYLSETGMFVTMALAHMDLSSGQMEVVNRGQSPVVLATGGQTINIAACGPPLGVVSARLYPAHRWTMSDNDLLFIGSDGCTDQRNASQVSIGESGVSQLVQNAVGQSAQAVVDAVIGAATAFTVEAEQDDDLTAIAIRRRHNRRSSDSH